MRNSRRSSLGPKRTILGEEMDEHCPDCGEYDEPVIEVVPTDNAWSIQTLTYYGPNSRSILLSGEINAQVANNIISQLMAMDRDNEFPIKFHINSPGGEAIQALAIYDAIRGIKCPVVTFAQGQVASAAFVIFQAGDVRVSPRNSLFFYHEPICESRVVSSMELIEQNSFYRFVRDRCDEIIIDKCGKKNFNKHMKGKTVKYLTAQEMERMGLLDIVLEYSERDVEIRQWENGEEENLRQSIRESQEEPDQPLESQPETKVVPLNKQSVESSTNSLTDSPLAEV